MLGAGGKMGPSLARRVRRACEAAGGKRCVIAASRFSETGVADSLERAGIEVVPCDLLDAQSVERLTDNLTMESLRNINKAVMADHPE